MFTLCSPQATAIVAQSWFTCRHTRLSPSLVFLDFASSVAPIEDTQTPGQTRTHVGGSVAPFRAGLEKPQDSTLDVPRVNLGGGGRGLEVLAVSFSHEPWLAGQVVVGIIAAAWVETISDGRTEGGLATRSLSVCACRAGLLALVFWLCLSEPAARAQGQPDSILWVPTRRPSSQLWGPPGGRIAFPSQRLQNC